MSGIANNKYSLLKSEKQKPYNSEAAAKLQQKYGLYGVESPLGNTYTQEQDDGTFNRIFESSDADVQRNQLIGQGLSQLSLDPTQAQDAYYNQATRLLNPQFENQTERLDENLINRGIGIGSEQYDRQTENLRNQQAGTLSDIANKSVFAGQDLLGSQINNISGLTGQRDINSLSSLATGTGFSGQSAYGNQIQQRNNMINQENQQNQQNIQNMAQLAMLASDKRLKENLQEVGKLDNGLTVYIGNYNDKAIELDNSLDKRPQLFLIAQEVKEVNPEAVGKDGEYYKVDYKEAVKNG